MKRTVSFICALGLVTLLLLTYQYVDLSWRVIDPRDRFVAVITKYETERSGDAAVPLDRQLALALKDPHKITLSRGRSEGMGYDPLASAARQVLDELKSPNASSSTQSSTVSTSSPPPSVEYFTRRLLKIPQRVSEMFPVHVSNTTPPCLGPAKEAASPNLIGNFNSDETDIFQIMSRWDKLDLPFFPNLYRLHIKTEDLPNLRRCHPRKSSDKHLWRRFVECSEKVHTSTPDELEGNHILFTLRTCAKFHKKRLPLLFHTWLENVNRSNVVIVTDDVDPVLQYRATEAGLRCYAVSVPGYERLCEKAGDEISLMFLPENLHYQWLCHVDDDMYVNLDRLVDVLANFKRDEPVYFGRAGSYPGKERIVPRGATLGEPGSRYHFAVGGMYCLSRSLLEKARRWIGARESFGQMCKVTHEPEDVTIGLIVGVLLGHYVNHTELIQSHGNDLEGVDPASLKYQVAISYGFGAVHWMNRLTNAVRVPFHLFSLKEDFTQFLSLHCHHHPTIGWCKQRLYKKQPPQRKLFWSEP